MNDTEKKLAQTFVDRLLEANLVRGYSDLAAVAGDDDRYGVRVSISPFRTGTVAHVLMMGMYDSDFNTYDDERPFTIQTIEVAAEVFGSSKINIGSVEGLSTGCETCGYNGRYHLSLFVFDPVVPK